MTKNKRQRKMDRNIENKFATVSGTCPLNQTSTQILINELKYFINIKKVELESSHYHLTQLEHNTQVLV